jgi:hypothetical protein
MPTDPNVLAYVFWHWRRDEVPASQYETLQRRFHRALAEAPPGGFLGSSSFAIERAPWAHAGSDAYEDWYRIRDSAAIDELEAGAISASRKLPHDAAAAAAAGGTAGLYTLRLGDATPRPRFAMWFAKPPGLGYDALFDTMTSFVRDGAGALWVRKMVLGPTPEMCFHCHEDVALPGAFQATRVVLRTVWPEPA